jgi:DNA polymerase-1
MKIIHTDEVEPHDLKPWEREQVYNGLDCCITAEVLEVLQPQLDNHTAATYAFSRALQGPVLEMRLRGIRIDAARKAEVIEEFFEKLDVLETNLERIVREGVGFHGFNWRSNPDLIKLFYDKLRIPPIRRQGRPTVNRDALERLELYTIAQPIVKHITTMRDIGKKIGVLRTEVDPDGRMRTSYNIAGTSTGRFSSSFSEFGTGTNLQNIEESLRSIFIADEGMKMAKFDAKQGESYCVGGIEWNLFRDGRYLDACEGGDLHTAVARLVWPDLAWTGDIKQDKHLAEQPYYRHYSRRFMCKKIGHGSNYGGKARTLSNQAKVELGLIEDFQPPYFRAFPAHLRWHAWTEAELQRTGTIVTLTGRKRQFWGRRTDQDTVREALAYDPQGSLADIVNYAMLNIWRQNIAQLYMHDHDALTVQYPEEQEDEIIPRVLKALEYPVELSHGRTLLIPYDAKVGFNKGEYNAKTNPDGLKDYIPGDKRKRSKEMHLLDRPIRRAYG